MLIKKGNALKYFVLIPIVAVFFLVTTIVMLRFFFDVVLQRALLLEVPSTVKNIVGVLVCIPVAVLMTRQVFKEGL